jgi:hypothetical protein
MKKLLVILLLTVIFLASNVSVFAACENGCTSTTCSNSRCNTCDFCTSSGLGQIGGDTGFGPWGNLGSESEVGASASAFTKILSNVIGIMTIIAGLWFMFQFIISGYAYMTAGEDAQRMGNATKKITSSLIGLVIVIAAYAIISLIGSMLGFEILNPQNIIPLLGPK